MMRTSPLSSTTRRLGWVAIAVAATSVGAAALVAAQPAAAAVGDFAIGNRVFADNGSDGGGGFNNAQRNNGVQDTGEAGVNGVRVDLYLDADSDGVLATSEFLKTTTTSAGDAGTGRPGSNADGYYLFDALDEGEYYVVIPASEFQVGDALGGWHSTSFNGNDVIGAINSPPVADLDDNGIEPTSRNPGVDGVRSSAIVLADGVATLTGETDLSHVAGSDSTPDTLSNVAVDFGFIPPMSIGNRIWLDDSSDPSQWSPGGSRNNGQIDATDDGNLGIAGIQNAGIVGVDLQLYFDGNNNTTIDAGDTLVSATTTVANGYYLFDGLAPGAYLVQVPSAEFATGQPLNGLVSAFDPVAQVSPANQTDSNDNGTDRPNPATSGISSAQIELQYLNEYTGESDNAPTNPRGRFGETNLDSDLTVDFGFVRAPLSIGNQVWLDDHPSNQALRNNGVFDAGETVLENVEVALYRDLDADGVVDAGEDTGWRDTTGSTGYYLFDNLPTGNYIIAITGANFTGGGPLENLISSRSTAPNPVSADNQTDNNDNGVDAAVSGVGIVSSRINLASGAEPTLESPNNEPADGVGGRGNHGEVSSSSDLTVDFGFYAPMSLGNRVWIDDSTNPANWTTTRNNGVRDATDDLSAGPLGVTLRLYRDLNADGVINTGEDTGRTTTTNAGGYYLFDGLSRGSYLVGVEASNFTVGGPLAGYTSSFTSTPPSDSNSDNTDGGVGVGSATVLSPRILLSYTNATTGLEVTGETDPSPQTQSSRGTNGELDAFSNLTVDFGFAAPAMSIGNRVWLDVTPADPAKSDNGVQDSTEIAASSIPVDLYSDANADGVPDGAPIASTVTDGFGYYLFDNLRPGGYLVSISAANFAAGGAFDGWVSSTTPSVADNQVDKNDNGVDGTGLYGVLSSRIVLSAGGEPTAESPSIGRGTHGEFDNSSDLTVDFGFVPATASVGDFVWFDTNGNGVQNSGEPGIAGVSLSIETESGDPVAHMSGDAATSEVTDATGAYSFDSLPLLGTGDHYVVRVDATSTALDGLTSTITGAGTRATDSSAATAESGDLLVDGARDATLDFGFVKSTVSVGDFAYVDRNGDGAFAPGEPGLAGVVVSLQTEGGDTVTDVDGDPVTAATTDADGAYSFDDLSPLDAGDHYVVLVDSFPAGHVATSGASQESGDLTADGDADLSLDFGFNPIVSVGDFVWFDSNSNGVQNSGEPGIEGVSLSIETEDGDPVAFASGVTVPSAVTDVDGVYAFDSLPVLPAGEHYVVRADATSTALDGLTPTLTGAGTGATDSSTTTAESDDLVLADDRDATLDFGFVRSTVTVGDFAWVDRDGDGAFAPGEPGLAGVTVSLETENGDPVTDIDGDVVGATTTDSNGAYGFEELPTLDAGEHYVAVVDSSPTGYVATTDTAQESGALTADGDADVTLDFGFSPVVAIGDFVWVDADRDGIQASDEPGLEGVTVSLYTSGNVAATHTDGSAVTAVTTDADGGYLFDDLLPGSYIVTFGAVADFNRTISGAGSSTTGSDASPTTGASSPFTVAASATGDTRTVVTGDDSDALFINATIDAGYTGRSNDLASTATYASLNKTTRQVTWNFTATNSGPDDFAGPLVATVTMPTGQSFVVAGSDAACASSAQVVTCSFPSAVAEGDTVSFTIVTRFAGFPKSLAIAATVDGGDYDYVLANNASASSVPSSALPHAPAPKPTPSPAPSAGSEATPTTPSVEPTPEATVTPTPTPATTVEPTPEPSPSTTALPSQTEAAGGPLAFLPWLIGGVLALGALIGAGVFLTRRRSL